MNITKHYLLVLPNENLFLNTLSRGIIYTHWHIFCFQILTKRGKIPKKKPVNLLIFSVTLVSLEQLRQDPVQQGTLTSARNQRAQEIFLGKFHDNTDVCTRTVDVPAGGLLLSGTEEFNNNFGYQRTTVEFWTYGGGEKDDIRLWFPDPDLCSVLVFGAQWHDSHTHNATATPNWSRALFSIYR